ncbi:MAG: spore coat associated protein CotJA [Ruminococcaceae bacterium]|nr:spore coat associated protein CotJA [Oscillospiraceae bacterium]
MPRQPSRPIRDLPPRVSCAGDQNTATACPTQLSAPSLAMVYSPRQCWRKLLEPHEGLKAGTIFTELILPLEAVSKNGSKEVNTRRCL